MLRSKRRSMLCPYVYFRQKVHIGENRRNVLFNLSCCYPYEADYKNAPVESKGREGFNS